MITFIVSIIILIIGYFTYGKYIDKMLEQKSGLRLLIIKGIIDYLPMKNII